MGVRLGFRFLRRHPKTTQGALSILNGFFRFLYRRPTAILGWSTGMESGNIVLREFCSENTDAGLYNLTPRRDLVQNIRGRKCDLRRSSPETFIQHTLATVVKIIRTDKMTCMRMRVVDRMACSDRGGNEGRVTRK